MFGGHSNTEPGGCKIPAKPGRNFLKKGCSGKRVRGTLRFEKNYVSFLTRRTFRFADYTGYDHLTPILKTEKAVIVADGAEFRKFFNRFHSVLLSCQCIEDARNIFWFNQYLVLPVFSFFGYHSELDQSVHQSGGSIVADCVTALKHRS